MRAGLPRNAAVATCAVTAAVGVALLTQRSSERDVHLADTNVRTVSFRSVPASRATRDQYRFRDSFVHELETIEAELDAVTRDEHLDQLLAGIDSASASNLLGRLQSEGPTRTTHAAELRLIRLWAEGDAAAAANWLTRISRETRSDALTQVAVAWVQRDSVAAAAWAKSLDDEERGKALAHIANEAVRTNPHLAFELARELPTSERRNDILLHAAAEIAATGKAEAALALVNNTTDESLHERLLSVIFASMADQDPAAAATATAERLPSRRPQDNAAMSIVQRWVQIDPAAAAGWVNSFPYGDLRRSAQLAIDELR
jgi:hypothetical protein